MAEKEEKTAGKLRLRCVKFEMPHETASWRCPVGCERLKTRVQKKSQSQKYKFESYHHTNGI